MMVIATVILSTNFGLASGQNKTYPGPTSIKGILANTTKANIVLVHGLWEDASSWDNVIPILLGAGHKVIAVQLPLHSLSVITALRRALKL